MTDSANLMPPAGWYNDPQDQSQLRYWDGDQWTDQTRPLPGTEPPQPEPPQPAPVARPAETAATAAAGSQHDLAVAEPQVQFADLATQGDVPGGQESGGIRFADEAAVESSPFRFAEEERIDVIETDPAETTGTAVTSSTATAQQRAGADVLVSTASALPGYRVTQVLGEVHAVAVRSRSSLSNTGGGFRAMLGGEAEGYSELLGESRNEAVAGLRAAAANMGANAVVAMRFDSGEIAELVNEVVAYGTAVVVAQE